MPKHYINPYLAGVLLGLVLLSSFVIAGRGIGASGAVNQAVVKAYETTGTTNVYARQHQPVKPFAENWIMIEVIGIFFGALLSAKLAGRVQPGMTKGAGVSKRKRLLSAALGGVLMGFGARMARGCTSGQALTGGALLSVGSWVFMLALFLGAYITIIFLRKDWQ